MLLHHKSVAVFAVAAAALASNHVGVHSFAPFVQNCRLGTFSGSPTTFTFTTSPLRSIDGSTSSYASSYASPKSSCQLLPTSTQLFLKTQTKTAKNVKTNVKTNTNTMDIEAVESEVDQAKKVELIVLGIWGISISAFILINNFHGPWPLILKQVPERWYFLSHMIGGMLFAGGIILTTCIERAVAKSQNPEVLQFWFTKVPELDGLIVVPALTVSMVSGTGLSIVRYGGLNIAPPHVGAIFWTLIAFMSCWAATDLTTQGPSLKAVERMYEQYEQGEVGLETPKVVSDRHLSNVVSCFFILLLYSMMVLKPGTYFPFPWDHWT